MGGGGGGGSLATVLEYFIVRNQVLKSGEREVCTCPANKPLHSRECRGPGP